MGDDPGDGDVEPSALIRTLHQTLKGLVLGVGFEPTRDLTPTRPSTLRVYQFHHPSRIGKEDVEDTDGPITVQGVNRKSSGHRKSTVLGPRRQADSR